jgi:hypothetical protein
MAAVPLTTELNSNSTYSSRSRPGSRTRLRA